MSTLRKFWIDAGAEENETLGHNNVSNATSTQIKSICSVLEYFKWAFLQDSTHSEKQSRCSNCSKNFMSFKALYRHAHTVHENSGVVPLECFICQKLLVSSEEFYDHQLTEHDIQNPDLICLVCLIRLDDENAYQNHVLCHQAEHICQQCTATFITEHQLSLHQQYDNCTRSELSCEICGISFQNIFLKGMHTLRHQQLECPFQCNSESRPFSAEVELVTHLKENHSEEQRHAFLKTVEELDQNECHIGELVGRVCSKTNLKFGHGKQEVEKWLSGLIRKLQTECVYCSCIMNSILQLWIHYFEKHCGSKTCPICNKQFKTVIAAVLHLGSKSCEIEQGNKSLLTCSQCGETFKQNHDLLYHQLTHIKPLQCPECSACFQRKLDLYDHLKKHNLPPRHVSTIYTCAVCSSRCPSLASLRKHIRSHDTVRPHHCDLCGMTFKRLPELRIHTKTVHSEQVHACTQCDTSCRSTDALSRHVARVHVRLRRFVCGLCGTRWPQNQDLRRHLKSIHRVIVPPLTKTVATPNVEVHVIPPMTNLKPADPLRQKIEQVIKEEKYKLRSLQSPHSAQSAEEPQKSTKNVANISDIAEDTPVSKTNEALPTNLEQEKEVFLSCASCDFRCQDVGTWLQHSAQHQQVVVNNQLNFIPVPVMPVQAFLLPPALPVVSYLTNIVTVPATGFSQHSNVTNFNMVPENAFPVTTGPVSMALPPAVNSLLLPTNQDNTPGGSLTSSHEKIERACCTGGPLGDLGEADQVIDINGMIVRIRRANELDAALLGKSGSVNSLFISGETSEEAFPADTLGKIDETVMNASMLFPDGGNLPGGVMDEVIKLVNDQNQPQLDQCLATQANQVIREIVPENWKRQDQMVLSGATGTLERFHAEKSENKDSVWQCSQCGKIVGSSKALERHTKAHEGVKPHSCPTCGKAFLAKHNLKVHLLIHSQERPFLCSICDKKMRYRKEYEEHMKQHQGIKDWCCSQCGRAFSRQRDLVRHRHLHSEEKRYQCPVCLKNFHRLDYLKQVHIPRKHGQLCCTICKRRFQTDEELQKHQRNHPKAILKEDKDRYMCPICDKTFAQNTGLKTHLELHKKRKTYVVCYSCPRKFCSVATMLTHCTNFHTKWKNAEMLAVRKDTDSANVLSHKEAPGEGDIPTADTVSHTADVITGTS